MPLPVNIGYKKQQNLLLIGLYPCRKSFDPSETLNYTKEEIDWADGARHFPV